MTTQRKKERRERALARFPKEWTPEYLPQDQNKVGLRKRTKEQFRMERDALTVRVSRDHGITTRDAR